MTNEEKQLLLKDLCARLPYDTIVNCLGNVLILKSIDYTVKGKIFRLKSRTDNGSSKVFDVSIIKPYLRPMSSMTEEEIKEFRKNSDFEEREAYEVRANGENKIVILQADCDLSVKELDWLNAHHFDYRGLIEKRLALEALEDMYKVSNG